MRSDKFRESAVEHGCQNSDSHQRPDNDRRRARRLLSGTALTGLAVLFCSLIGILSAEEIQFSESDSETAKLAVELLRSRHLDKPQVDDAVSEQLAESFPELWDGRKLYFRKTDIEQFRTQRTTLDDSLRKGDVYKTSIAIWSAVHGIASFVIQGADFVEGMETELVDTVVKNLLRGLGGPKSASK